jgi:hypothetical protein
MTGLIENQTPYLGKIKLKFEKSPYYTGKSFLNKVHLNLGFTKLVSRIFPNRSLEGWEIDPEKTKLIENYTGGKIGTHVFGQDSELALHNSFLGPNDEYLGDIAEGWRYYKNNLIVNHKRPHGVALVVKREFFGMLAKRDGIVEDYFSSFVVGYYGYSHRGGSIFKIGDRLFDPNYFPIEEDYPKEVWQKFEKKRRKTEARNRKEGWLKEGDKIPISDVIPFKMRGKIVIENWDQAEQSAINMSEYLS